MTRIIKFGGAVECYSVGRNGHIKTTGLEVMSSPAGTPGARLYLSPITSRGEVANCRIEMPVAEVPAFVTALTSVTKEQGAE